MGVVEMRSRQSGNKPCKGPLQHLKYSNGSGYCDINELFRYEPCSEKTGLWGFRPGLTQTRLYSHRRWLEAGNFVFRKFRDCTICVAKTKALISFAVTQLRGYREADLRLCFRICKKTLFS